MHSKDLVVILGEIARAGQDHYSAMQLSSFIGEAVVMLCIGFYTKPQSGSTAWLALHPELYSDSRNRLVHHSSPTLLPC